MAKIDQQIDDLYQLPPAEFTASRNALAKTLTGDAARQVRALKKPPSVAWAVNQVYWKARPVYDALLKAGHALRTAQIAALKGRTSDVRGTTDAHRRAVAQAVLRAQTIAGGAGVNANTEQLARMFDAVSLASNPSSETGRFAELVEPSGFDALAGVKPAKSALSRGAAKERKAAKEKKEARDAEARLDRAMRALERAHDRAEAARRALNRAEADVAAAQREVDAAQSQVTNPGSN